MFSETSSTKPTNEENGFSENKENDKNGENVENLIETMGLYSNISMLKVKDILNATLWISDLICMTWMLSV